MNKNNFNTQRSSKLLICSTVCQGAAVAVVELTDGTLQTVGLTVVAFLGAPLFEVPVIFTERGYEEYREQWTKDNWPPAESGRTRLG
jgi:hypothetical protein